MPEKVKLIWDFYGPDAERTAQHHLSHVLEFVRKQQLPVEGHGVEQFVEGHWMACLVVLGEQVEKLRAVLRPQRGLPA